ncbi:MlaD family protein [Planctomycetota bacterium]
MVKKIRNEVAVGITTLVVLVLTIYIVVTLADWSSLFTAQQKITVKLPYKIGLSGLSIGSPVHLGGIKIGHITHTQIKKLNPATTDTNDVYVFFTMKIPQQYQLRSDCVLLPESNVLGGQALLSIEDLGSEGEIIKDGQTVELILADDVMEVIKHEFDSENPNSILALVKYEVNSNNPDSVITYLKQIAVELEKGIPTIISQIEQTFAKASSALETAQSTLKKAKEITEDERIDKTINNISEVSTNLKLTSQEVRRAPWKLLYKPKEKEFKIQALVDSAGAFAVSAERLDNAALRLQKLITPAKDKEVVDEERISSMVAELETSFEKYREAEKKFWDELK